MITPTVIEIDCTTGATIERPMTADEVAQRDADALAWEQSVAAAEAAAAAREAAKVSAIAKLEALGLSVAEASVVLGV